MVAGLASLLRDAASPLSVGRSWVTLVQLPVTSARNKEEKDGVLAIAPYIRYREENYIALSPPLYI